jgi:hypothetical protein
MLHPRTRYSLDFGEVGTLILQPLQDEVDSFEEQCGRCEDLALGRIGEDSFLDAILCEVGIEVDLSFVNEFEV